MVLMDPGATLVVGCSNATARFALMDVATSLRPHHWVKNLLVFAPLFWGAPLSLDGAGRLGGVFIGFSLLSSAGYLINDRRDYKIDRQHPAKKFRPMARGSLPENQALPLAGALATMGLSGFALLSRDVFAAACAYFIFSVLYTYVFKKSRWVDVGILAGLLSIRIWAGCVALIVRPNFWEMAFVLFLTLSLACAKRLMENWDFMGQDPTGLTPYRSVDGPRLSRLGILAAGVALLAFLFNAVWGRGVAGFILGVLAFLLLLVGLARLWWGVRRDRFGRDILHFFLTDKTNQGFAAIFLLCLFWSRL